MSRCGALGSQRPRASFKVTNLEQDLTRLLKSGNVEQHRDVLDRPQASAALAGHLPSLSMAALKYKVLSTFDSKELPQSQPSPASAREAGNVYHTSHTFINLKDTLNHCKTEANITA